MVLDSIDVYVIDIKYYKSCWVKYVIGVLCKIIKDDKERLRSEIVVKLQFLNFIKVVFDSGEIFNMVQLEQVFDFILNENNSLKIFILSKQGLF